MASHLHSWGITFAFCILLKMRKDEKGESLQDGGNEKNGSEIGDNMKKEKMRKNESQEYAFEED